MEPQPQRGDMSVARTSCRSKPQRGDMSVEECLLLIIIQIHGTLYSKRPKGKYRFAGNNKALSQ
jgi:hypothetical protein